VKEKVLGAVPIRNPVPWQWEDDIVVITYPKNFSRLEVAMHKRIGGPEDIRRPLDKFGSLIWLLCDGDHNVSEICEAMYEEFHEDIEPVADRVTSFLSLLLRLNLIRLEQQDDKKVKPQRVKKKNG